MKMADDQKRKQVADQCKVVAHLATALAQTYNDFAKIFDAGALDSLVDQAGSQSAKLMETLGNILNNMDANDEEKDAWCDVIFERAHRIFPVKDQPFQ